MRIVTALILALFLLAPARATAQRGFTGLGVSAGWAGWTGDDLGDLEPGVVLRLDALTQVGRTMGLGVTLGYGFSGLKSTGAGASELALGFTGRWAVVGDPAATHLQLAFHLGWSRLAVDVPDGDLDVKEDGIKGGPGLAIAVPLSPTLTFVAGGDYHLVNYQSTLSGTGPGGEGTSDWGGRWGVTAGVAITRRGRRR